MFQNLLADRFKLVIHRRTAYLPVYALVVAKGGLKINKAAPQERAESPLVDSDAASSLDGFYGTVQSRTIPGDDYKQSAYGDGARDW